MNMYPNKTFLLFLTISDKILIGRLLKRVDKIEHFSGMINNKMDKLIER